MKKTTTIAGVAVAAVLATGGAAWAAGSGSDDQTPGTVTATSTAGVKGVTAREAAAIAVRHVGGGKVTDIERDSDDGHQEWNVEVRHDGKEFDVDVDAATADVTDVDQDNDRDDDRDDSHDDDRGHDRDDD